MFQTQHHGPAGDLTPGFIAVPRASRSAGAAVLLHEDRAILPHARRIVYPQVPPTSTAKSTTTPPAPPSFDQFKTQIGANGPQLPRVLDPDFHSTTTVLHKTPKHGGDASSDEFSLLLQEGFV
ncbi:hypothetical protein KVR01_013283 [Diaporthe batatas]|uniref:uncharacterized protein n=1 Tax=Diaporthe batatas TaxID=748121 RepID=UPI001D03A862|nr:uncharacterized protein KVR01_013283 [Diaporthe batatas]KAG8156870.1 hypothetical protein KVR01_013283 [Diaporthe batatas]